MIELANITKYYTRGFFRKQKSLIVDDVSLSIRRGETLGLVGESGSGKTTLGRIALRLIEPSSGTVRFDGVDVTSLSRSALRQFRQRMQIIFQDPDTSLNPRMTIHDCVAEPFRIWRLAGAREMEDRIPELLGLVGLQPELASRYPFEISGGQKQRVALARVLALNPTFIVADEPTAALDLSVQAQVLSLLKDIQQKRQLTLLFISHDLQVIEKMSDRIAVMHKGRIVEQGATSQILRHPTDRYTIRMIAAAHESEAWFGKESPVTTE
ncbi:ATP-binding cassette domain-containing protein [Methanoregula sp.]|uniref:ATP-binding cassette domain-containing protein n=1 Tax=Methanoregula sp. TaxID=2052170 RepID=UPI003C715181